MLRLALILSVLAVLPACLVKYTYSQTGPEYEERPALSPVLVFMDTQPRFPVDPVGILAFTDPLAQTAQIEEAKRHARLKGGNVLIRVQGDGTEKQGGFTFRIGRAEDATIQAAVRAAASGSGPGPAAGFNPAYSGGPVYGEFAAPDGSVPDGSEPPLYKYYIDN